jgi:hypothetical protein
LERAERAEAEVSRLRQERANVSNTPLTPEPKYREKCEACGIVGAREYIFVRVTNGVLNLCRQCLDEFNAKNPELTRLRAENAKLREGLRPLLSDRRCGCCKCVECAAKYDAGTKQRCATCRAAALLAEGGPQ